VAKRPVTAARNLARQQQRRAATGARRAAEGVRDQVVQRVKGVLKAVKRPLRQASRRRKRAQEQAAIDRVEWGIEEEIEALVLRGRTLVVGPWISEVGFEALYWVPFLHWLKAAFRLEPARLVAVSRGGVAGWYAGVAGRYVEIWDHVTPEDFARRNAERGVTKQYERSALDDAILDAVARELGTREFDVIHPGLMYRLFSLFWSGQRAMGFMDAHTRFEAMTAPPVIDPALLPREYIAVKLYAARSLPDTPDIRARLKGLVASLAERLPVVLLDTGLVLEDDHADYSFAAGGRVVSAKGWMTPSNNLGAQTQIVAAASAFVGTCGSLAWLTPRLGVDTSALYVDPKWLHAHLSVAMRAYHKLGAGRFAAADLRALQMLPSFDTVR
jgi:hypothetical protein